MRCSIMKLDVGLKVHTGLLGLLTFCSCTQDLICIVLCVNNCPVGVGLNGSLFGGSKALKRSLLLIVVHQSEDKKARPRTKEECLRVLQMVVKLS